MKKLEQKEPQIDESKKNFSSYELNVSTESRLDPPVIERWGLGNFSLF